MQCVETCVMMDDARVFTRSHRDNAGDEYVLSARTNALIGPSSRAPTCFLVDLERGIFYRKAIGKRATKTADSGAGAAAVAYPYAALERAQAVCKLLCRVQRQTGGLG
jgi:hypothetical protein